MKKKGFCFLLLVFPLFFNLLAVKADNIVPAVKNPFQEIGFKKDHVYASVDKLTDVDLSNGHLTVSIPLGGIQGNGAGSYSASYRIESFSNILIGEYTISRNAAESQASLIINNAMVWKGTKGHNPAYPGSYDSKNEKANPIPDGTLDPATTVNENGSITGYNLPSFSFIDENGITHNLRWGIENQDSSLPPLSLTLDSQLRLDPYQITHSPGGDSIATYDFKNKGIYGAGGIQYLFNTTGTSSDIVNIKKDMENNKLEFHISSFLNNEGGTYYRLTRVKNNNNRQLEFEYSDFVYKKADGTNAVSKVLTRIYRIDTNGNRELLREISYGVFYNYEYNSGQLTKKSFVILPTKIKIYYSDNDIEEYEFIYTTKDDPSNTYSFFVADGLISYPVLLKRIKLPTGGYIDFDWQLYAITAQKDDSNDLLDGKSPNTTTHPSTVWFLYANLGIKSINYYDEHNTLTQKISYSLLKTTFTGSTDPSATNYYSTFLNGDNYTVTDEISYNISQDTPLNSYIHTYSPWPTDHLPDFLDITNGRRQRVFFNGSSTPFTTTDTIFTRGISKVDSKVRPEDKLVLKTITYAGAPSSSTYKKSLFSYTRTQYKYHNDNNNVEIYLMGSFKKSSTVSTEYKNGNLVKKVVTKTQYELAPNLFFEPVGSIVSVFDGQGNRLYSKETTSYKYYSFSPWLSITDSSVTKITSESNDTSFWKVKNNFYGSRSILSNKLIQSGYGYFWRISNETHGIAQENTNIAFNYQDPEFVRQINFMEGKKRIKIDYTYTTNGLVSSRTLNLLGSNASITSIIENFDYSYGVLSKYQLTGTDGLSLITTREIDPSTGWVKKQTNPDGTYTTYQYDRMGRLTRIDNSVTGIIDSQIQYIPYNPSTHESAQVILSGILQGHYYYDGLGRLKYAGEDNGGGYEWAKIDYLGLSLKKQEWSGAKASSLSAITNWNNITSYKKHYYDGFGREIKTETYKKGGALFSILETNYNGFYKTVTLKDAGGNIQEQKKVKYDAEDHIKAVWVRNNSGNLIKKLSYNYHPLFGKLTKATLYKEDGQTIGQVRTWDYDELGNLIKSVTPEEGQITYGNYNIFGKWGTKAYADGTTINIIYDGLGRETQIKSENTILKNITYGTNGASIGKITRLTRNNTYGTVKTTYTYNQSQTTGRGLLTGKTYTIILPSSIMGQGLTITRTINYNYNSKGLLSNITYPAETISGIENLQRVLHFTYTPTGTLIKEVTLNATGTNYTMPGKQLISNVNYGAFGSINYTMGDSTINQILNDSLGRLQKIESKFSDGNLLSNYQYTYDIKGNIKTIQEDLIKDGIKKGRDIAYTYDNYNRLISATYNQGTVRPINDQRTLTDNINYLEQFAYDYAGNLIKKTFNNPSNYGFKNAKTFNIAAEFTNNRIPGGTYDGRGNLLKVKNPDREVTLTYDPLNMVEKTETTIYSANNTTTVYGYIYDGDGKRVGKILLNGNNAENLSIYIRDNNGKILEQLKIDKDENGNWQTNWFKDNYWVWDKLISSASAE